MDEINQLDYLETKFGQDWERCVCCIEGLTYFLDYNEFYDKVSFLDITFGMRTNKTNGEYKIVLRFTEVTDLNMIDIGGSYNQLVSFKIIDIRDRNWGPEKRYFVEDYETDRFKFYCKSVGVISVNPA